MAKKIYRIVSWALLAFTLFSLVLVLEKPTGPQAPTSADAGKSFDTKLNQLALGQQDAPQEIHITEMELNSKLKESLESPDPSSGRRHLNGATVHMEGDRITGTFTVGLLGRDVSLTLGGNLGVRNGVLEFNPTAVRLGAMPVPVGLIEPALRQKLSTPEMRERLTVPDSIKDIRIENGEMVFERK
jgi:hypothetical protein